MHSMSFPEHDLVPFNATKLAGERLLVLAPHPDDEAIGCGGLIALHARDRRSIRVVVATDGAASGEQSEPGYTETRKEETRRGLRILGAADVNFLEIPDRSLSRHSDRLQELLRDEILGYAPDLIACPAPTEIHPDHVALARALLDLLQRDRDLLGRAAMTRVAFYEVSQPFRPNTLVDISEVADEKFAAIAAHATQLGVRDYDAYARGLNRYRAMTLPAGASYAEAYWVAPLADLHTTNWSELRKQIGPAPEVEITREALPITVVIRTKDRLPLLRDALDSVRANDYPAEMVVVNDGGQSPAELTTDDDNLLLIEHGTPRGRSEAMNAGVRAAATSHIAFLDDDDIFYDDHLRTLAGAATQSGAIAHYTDALSVFMEMSDAGSYEPAKKLRLYAQPFDREMLVLDNYIPLPTLLVTRDAFLDAGGFDPELDLFEDWDFLLRLARKGSFLRVPRLTCEIRHYPSAGSVIVDNPESSSAFREAKLRIWKRHFDPPDPHVIANVFERQKRALIETYQNYVSETGRGRHLETDISRLEREKAMLIEDVGRETAARLSAENDCAALRAENDLVRAELENVRTELSSQIGGLTLDLERITAGFEERGGTIHDLYAEIERLNSVLDAIHQSRTWKLHRLVERIQGKA
jgi:LmbE family N-acetylglucosaminyl deacetylase/glycosyltransferase involved in cell wall biosynthesis